MRAVVRWYVRTWEQCEHRSVTSTRPPLYSVAWRSVLDDDCAVLKLQLEQVP